jgi:hypothetical protein
MSKKRTQKLEDMSQTHGKKEDVQYKTLDQIWGDTGQSRYSATNEKEYIEYINEMNKTDLHAHANKIGLIPIDNRESLTKRLVLEFKKFISMYKFPKNTDNTITLNKSAKNILAEGK